MTTSDILNDLADRVETEASNKELIFSIVEACGWASEGNGWYALPNGTRWFLTQGRNPLTSVDVAISLMPTGWLVSSDQASPDMWEISAGKYADNLIIQAIAPTEARGRTAAALRCLACEIMDQAVTIG